MVLEFANNTETESPQAEISIFQPALGVIRELIPIMTDVHDEKTVLLKGLSILVAARDLEAEIALQLPDGTIRVLQDTWKDS